MLIEVKDFEQKRFIRKGQIPALGTESTGGGTGGITVSSDNNNIIQTGSDGGISVNIPDVNLIDLYNQEMETP